MDNETHLERVEGESERHFSLFKAYVSLGHERSYADVAEAAGLSRSTIERYGARFSWIERARAYDAACLASFVGGGGDLATRLVALRERQLSLAEALTDKAARALLAYDDLWRPLEALAVLQMARSLVDDLEARAAADAGDSIEVTVRYEEK